MARLKDNRMQVWMLVVALCALLLLVANSFGQEAFGPAEFHPSIEVRNTGDITLNQYCNGWLYGVEVNQSANPLIYRMDKDGRLDRYNFSIPKAGQILVRGFACGSDGRFALSGRAYADDGRLTTFLATISADRKRSVITRLWPFVAERIVIAADGVVWAAGEVSDDDNRYPIRTSVLRRYDASGRLLGEVAPDPPVKLGHMIGDAYYYSSLRAGKDRVAWITCANEFIEFSLDGKERYRGAGPPVSNPEVSGGATSFDYDSGDRVIAADTHEDGQVLKLWALDRGGRRWRPVTVRGRIASWGRILGFDGRALVLMEDQLKVKIYPLLPAPSE